MIPNVQYKTSGVKYSFNPLSSLCTAYLYMSFNAIIPGSRPHTRIRVLMVCFRLQTKVRACVCCKLCSLLKTYVSFVSSLTCARVWYVYVCLCDTYSYTYMAVGGRILLKNRTKGLAGKKFGLRDGEKAEHAKLVSFVIKKIINVLCATTGKNPMVKKYTHTHLYT